MEDKKNKKQKKQQQLGADLPLEDPLSIYFSPYPTSLGLGLPGVGLMGDHATFPGGQRSISGSSLNQSRLSQSIRMLTDDFYFPDCSSNGGGGSGPDWRQAGLKVHNSYPSSLPVVGGGLPVFGSAGDNNAILPHQINCADLHGDGGPAVTTIIVGPVVDKPAVSGKTVPVNARTLINSSMMASNSSGKGKAGQKELAVSELTSLIDPQLFELCGVGPPLPEQQRDLNGGDDSRNESPKSDVPTEPITPHLRSAAGTGKRGSLDMPDLQNTRSVEDQLVRSNQLMETILNSMKPSPTHHSDPRGSRHQTSERRSSTGGPLVFQPLKQAPPPQQQQQPPPPAMHILPPPGHQQFHFRHAPYPPPPVPPQFYAPMGMINPQQVPQQMLYFYSPPGQQPMLMRNLPQMVPPPQIPPTPPPPQQPQQQMAAPLNAIDPSMYYFEIPQPPQQSPSASSSGHHHNHHHQQQAQQHYHAPQPPKICSNCGTNSTPSWRRCPDGKELLCNACGLYAKLHHRPRPFKMAEDGSVRVVRSSALYNSVMEQQKQRDSSSQVLDHSCEQCGVEEGAAYRGGRINSYLCDSCCIFLSDKVGTDKFRSSTGSAPPNSSSNIISAAGGMMDYQHDTLTESNFLASLVTSEPDQP